MPFKTLARREVPKVLVPRGHETVSAAPSSVIALLGDLEEVASPLLCLICLPLIFVPRSMKLCLTWYSTRTHRAGISNVAGVNSRGCKTKNKNRRCLSIAVGWSVQGETANVEKAPASRHGQSQRDAGIHRSTPASSCSQCSWTRWVRKVPQGDVRSKESWELGFACLPDPTSSIGCMRTSPKLVSCYSWGNGVFRRPGVLCLGVQGLSVHV